MGEFKLPYTKNFSTPKLSENELLTTWPKTDKDSEVSFVLGDHMSSDENQTAPIPKEPFIYFLTEQERRLHR